MSTDLADMDETERNVMVVNTLFENAFECDEDPVLREPYAYVVAFLAEKGLNNPFSLRELIDVIDANDSEILYELRRLENSDVVHHDYTEGTVELRDGPITQSMLTML